MGLDERPPREQSLFRDMCHCTKCKRNNRTTSSVMCSCTYFTQEDYRMDIALLLIHGFVGALILAHGIGHLFGRLGSGDGLAATSEYVASLGLRPARLMGVLLGATEVAAGALLALGLL